MRKNPSTFSKLIITIIFIIVVSIVINFTEKSKVAKDISDTPVTNTPVVTPPIQEMKSINNDSYSDIIVQSPMTLSNNDIYSLNGKNQFLRLRMIKGKYYEDWTPGPYMGTIWEGYYNLELIDEAGNIISQLDLSKVYSEPMIFNFSFQIEFDDYNNDGDLDFTIGQYASSNGREYKLFTLRKDGRIEILPIKDYSSLFISNTTGYYSTKLTKKTNTSFSKEFYDNSKGINIEDNFKWDGKEFIKNN